MPKQWHTSGAKMTKLTEEILRAQTCPFELRHNHSKQSIIITGIGERNLFYREPSNSPLEYPAKILTVIYNYKLPEPEPKLVTMYECVDWRGDVVFMNKYFQPIDLSCQVFAKIDVDAVRIPNGRTMQLDISGESWEWVTE